MRKLFHFILMGTLLVGVSAPALSEAPEVSVEIDRDEVVLGDRIHLTITVEGISTSSPPELPPIPDFDVQYLGSRTESYTSVTVIVQGKKVEEKKAGGGITFEYALAPKRAGHLTIPHFSFLLERERYHTSQPYLILVTDLPEKREDIFVNVSVDQDEVFLGESILLTFEWYFDKNLEDYSLHIPWYGALKDFLVEDPESDPKRQVVRMIVNDKEKVAAEKKTVTFRGKPYGVLSFQKILTPISAGRYPLDPVFLRAEVVSGYERPQKRRFLFKDYFDWAFDDFFGKRAITETVVARSKPLLLTVKPLPEENRPSTFTGAVGDFDFQVTADAQTVQIGEPVTVTMKVIGSGNFNEIQLPEFPELPAFKGYAPEIRTETSLADGMVIGEKTFGKVLVGRREGAYEVPPLSFSFFDPEAGVYKTVTRGPFPIRVEKGAVQETPLVSPLSPEPERQRKEVKVITQDIRYIKTELGPMNRKTTPPYADPTFWFFGFVPLPLITAFSFLIQRRRLKFQRDIGYARHRQALGQAQKALAECAQFLKEDDAGAFYSGLSRTLTHFLGDKLNRSPAGISGEIVETLREKGADPDVLQKLKDCFERIDIAKYSSASASPEEMKETLERIKGLLHRLEREI